MLTCAEELILIALDDHSGEFHRMPMLNFQLALVGAMLMELHLQNRIEVDVSRLYILNTDPTGNPILDEVMSLLSSYDKAPETAKTIRILYTSLKNLLPRLLQDLENKGIIQHQDKKILHIFKHNCYPMIDDKEERQALSRLRQTVMSDSLPEPRSCILIALIDICDLMDKLFSPEELTIYQQRLALLRNLDMIGHSVIKIIEEVQIMIASSLIT